MNEASTVTVGIARPTVRKLNRNELLNALPTDLRRCLVEEESDPREAGLRRELVGWVAEVQGRSTGALLCVVLRAPTAAAGTSAIQNLARRFRNLLGSRRELPLLVELLDVVVESETDCANRRACVAGAPGRGTSALLGMCACGGAGERPDGAGVFPKRPVQGGPGVARLLRRRGRLPHDR